MKIYRVNDADQIDPELELIKSGVPNYSSVPYKDHSNYIRMYKKFWLEQMSDTYDSIILKLNNIYICPSHEYFVRHVLHIEEEYPINFETALSGKCVFVDIEKTSKMYPVNIFYSPQKILSFQYEFLEMMAIIFECNLYGVTPCYRKFSIKEKRPLHLYEHEKAGTVLEDGSDLILKYSPPNRYRDSFL
jgi:hypothetical protein